MLNRKLLLFLGLAALVAIGLIGYGDFRETGRELAGFPLPHLLAALALAAVNYILRLVRWVCYLKALEIRIPLGDSSLVFLSGLAMSVTPGKAGEVAKCYLLRDRWGIEISRSLPVVLMERLTDLAAVVLLALAGLALLPTSWMVGFAAVLAAAGLVALGIVLYGGSSGRSRLLNLPVLRRWKDDIAASQQAMRRLALPGVMSMALSLSLLAWLSEGLALWVVLDGLDAPLDVHRAIPVYAAATLAGAITAIPGGLVGTEGSMLALLQQGGIDRATASAATLLVRLATLWFAVAIGLAAWVWIIRSRKSTGAADGAHQTAGPLS